MKINKGEIFHNHTVLNNVNINYDGNVNLKCNGCSKEIVRNFRTMKFTGITCVTCKNIALGKRESNYIAYSKRDKKKDAKNLKNGKHLKQIEKFYASIPRIKKEKKERDRLLRDIKFENEKTKRVNKIYSKKVQSVSITKKERKRFQEGTGVGKNYYRNQATAIFSKNLPIFNDKRRTETEIAKEVVENLHLSNNN